MKPAQLAKQQDTGRRKKPRPSRAVVPLATRDLIAGELARIGQPQEILPEIPEDMSSENSELGRKLAAGGYEAFEQACGITLTDRARWFLRANLYACGCLDPSYAAHVDKEERLLAKTVGAVARKLSPNERRLVFTGYAYALLREHFLDEECRRPRQEAPGSKSHSFKRLHLQFLADVFEFAGGRVAISDDGPFARFLTEAWKYLPEKHRGQTPQALIKYAKRNRDALDQD